MNHLALTTMNENSIRIQQYDPALFDYRGITLATNKGVSHILEENKNEKHGYWEPRIRVDKLALNEALIMFREVRYSASRLTYEAAGYLSRKNHSAESMVLWRNGAAADIMSRASSLQDLPVHSLTDVVIHTPYGLRLGNYSPSWTKELSGYETITRAAGIGIPPILTFGKVNDVVPAFTITLGSANSIDINDVIKDDAYLNLPAMITGIPRDVRQHGGEYTHMTQPNGRYAVVFRFSENVR